MKRREIPPVVARVAAAVGLVACAAAGRPATPAPIAPATSKPAPPPLEPDRTPIATEPSPARHINTRADECPMHLRGPVPHDSVDEWLGWSARLLHRCQGEPDVRSEERWIYNLPDGCSEERSEITVLFAKGVVISTKVKTRHTGEHCDF